MELFINETVTIVFVASFTKVAFTSPHTQEKSVRATPKKYGGTNAGEKYSLKFHPEEKRWSCSCPDWQVRRKGLGKEHKAHHDCKHIKAHKLKSKSWLVKPRMKPVPKQDSV